MRYVLAIKQPVYGSQGAFLAYQFALALLEQGHQISQVLFMQNGVSNGNGFVYPANDEFNLQQHWQALSKQHHIPLHLCIAASQRRGVVDALTSKDKQQNNLAEGFVLAGLGEFSQAVLQADRVITL
ncbi:sulfurtransferase complex subunit TusD [Avibacterium sp. 21-594]|uniref:sulfurtransferase complex subunit TusD n=1 Tax=Avibacterium sp. 21-594 TaxID=2911535 RepID=UPI002246A244|nr:sulfurtransferase complex subunit TusD [Avibacterium sp. 21-594]MCW9715650.1 sulfurtransferase complex subunit TusD [Avibacterium sp. 21-594]